MKIVVGLGNPGKQYEETRHNVGWMVLDRLAERAGWTGHARARDAAATVHGRYNGLDLMLVKPTTYMNLSGVAVRKVLARQRAPLERPAGRRRRLRPAARQAAPARARAAPARTTACARSSASWASRISRGCAWASASRRADADRSRPERGSARPSSGSLDEVIDAAADAVEDWARTGAGARGQQVERLDARASTDTAADGTPPSDRGDGRLSTRDDPASCARRTGWRRLLPRIGRGG